MSVERYIAISVIVHVLSPKEADTYQRKNKDKCCCSRELVVWLFGWLVGGCSGAVDSVHGLVADAKGPVTVFQFQSNWIHHPSDALYSGYPQLSGSRWSGDRERSCFFRRFAPGVCYVSASGTSSRATVISTKFLSSLQCWPSKVSNRWY